MDSGVIQINRTGVFSFGEARQLIPVIKKITSETKAASDQMMNQLESMDDQTSPEGQALEEKINELLKDWNQKISRLGGISKGLWLVDFDSGDGFYCWKHPEPDLLYWHAYQEGFSGRVHIHHKVQVDHSF